MKGLYKRFVLWCPGAVGLLLRRRFFTRRLKSCGRGVLIGRFVALHRPEKIRIGARVILNDGAVLDAGHNVSGGTICLGNDVFIGSETLLMVRGHGSIIINEGTSVGSFCQMVTTRPLTIGRDCLIAAYCSFGESAPVCKDAADKTGANTVVENGCWLGIRVLISAGVKIGKETVVGAHTVVEFDQPEYAVVFGHPARKIRSRRGHENG